jgi:hypothetical protein
MKINLNWVEIKLYESYRKKKLFLFLLLMLKISWKFSKKLDKNIKQKMVLQMYLDL